METGELGCTAPAGRRCGKFLPEESRSDGPMGPWVQGLVFQLPPQLEKGLRGRACLARAAQARTVVLLAALSHPCTRGPGGRPAALQSFPGAQFLTKPPPGKLGTGACDLLSLWTLSSGQGWVQEYVRGVGAS